MKQRPLTLALLAGILALAGPMGEAAARPLSIDYAVSIRGFPVGKMKLRAEIVERRYSIAVSGGITGLARFFADTRTSAEAIGLIGDDRPRAESYSHVWIEDKETETVAMRFEGRGVSEIALEPPRRRPERYVPMTAEDTADAVDLVSAFLWPAASGATPQTCDRTLPLIDGKRRFDIESAFVRMESFATRRSSLHHRAVVCSLRYRAIAGHRADKEGDNFLSMGDDMEVWLTSAGGGLALPVKVQLTTRFGRVVVEAIAFETE